jgi:hypothetical protein
MSGIESFACFTKHPINGRLIFSRKMPELEKDQKYDAKMDRFEKEYLQCLLNLENYRNSPDCMEWDYLFVTTKHLRDQHALTLPDVERADLLLQTVMERNPNKMSKNDEDEAIQQKTGLEKYPFDFNKYDLNYFFKFPTWPRNNVQKMTVKAEISMQIDYPVTPALVATHFAQTLYNRRENLYLKHDVTEDNQIVGYTLIGQEQLESALIKYRLKRKAESMQEQREKEKKQKEKENQIL